MKQKIRLPLTARKANNKTNKKAPIQVNVIKLRKEPSSEMSLALFLQIKVK